MRLSTINTEDATSISDRCNDLQFFNIFHWQCVIASGYYAFLETCGLLIAMMRYLHIDIASPE